MEFGSFGPTLVGAFKIKFYLLKKKKIKNFHKQSTIWLLRNYFLQPSNLTFNACWLTCFSKAEDC